MHENERLASLPKPYALALRLEAAGADEALIADCLGVEPAAVSALLTLAAAKLRSAAAAGSEVLPRAQI